MQIEGKKGPNRILANALGVFWLIVVVPPAYNIIYLPCTAPPPTCILCFMARERHRTKSKHNPVRRHPLRLAMEPIGLFPHSTEDHGRGI